MADQNSSEWDRILSQRLSRESQNFPAAKPEDARAQPGAQPAQPSAPPPAPFAPASPHAGTIDFDSGAVANAAENLREISAEGSVHPAPPASHAPPTGQPGLPRGYGGITLGWAIGDNVAAVNDLQQRRESLHSTIKTQEGIWSVGPAGSRVARGATDPKMVVDELRKLTPQEEQRAFDILRGGGRGSRRLLVAVLGLVTMVASAGLALLVHARVAGDRELRLVDALSPPEESVSRPVVAEAAPATPKEAEAAPEAGPGLAAGAGATEADEAPPEKAPREEEPDIETKPPEAEPKIVKADQRLVTNDGPTFAVGAAPPKREWVDIAGPDLDFDDAPTVVDGDRTVP